jgi:hypothetical protein
MGERILLFLFGETVERWRELGVRGSPLLLNFQGEFGEGAHGVLVRANEALGSNSAYELCATFATNNRHQEPGEAEDAWRHPKGDCCFPTPPNPSPKSPITTDPCTCNWQTNRPPSRGTISRALPLFVPASGFFPKGHGLPCPSLVLLFDFFPVVSPPLR